MLIADPGNLERSPSIEFRLPWVASPNSPESESENVSMSIRKESASLDFSLASAFFWHLPLLATRADSVILESTQLNASASFSGVRRKSFSFSEEMTPRPFLNNLCPNSGLAGLIQSLVLALACMCSLEHESSSTCFIFNTQQMSASCTLVSDLLSRSSSYLKKAAWDSFLCSWASWLNWTTKVLSRVCLLDQPAHSLT